MKQDFSDRASFLKALTALREAAFTGSDLIHHEPKRTVSLTLTRVDSSSSGIGGGFFGRRKPAYLKTVLTVRRVAAYKQSLALGPEDVYVLDRGEVGRGGQEIALYFRPGDRAVMDVEQIDGSVEDVGKATSAPQKPTVANPLATQEARASRGEALAGRRGRKGGKRGP